MNRRSFLTIAGIGGVVAAFATGKFFTTSFEQAAEDLIKAELHFLQLDGQGVKDFVKEYSKINDRRYKLIVKGYSLAGISTSQSGKVHQLVSSYLLSSDFFRNNMNENKVIRYVGLYDPYIRPCSHPFSHLRYQEGTQPVT